jgi:hypothetical protein
MRCLHNLKFVSAAAGVFSESDGAANVGSVSRLYGYNVSLLCKGKGKSKGKPAVINKFPCVTNQMFLNSLNRILSLHATFN